MCLTHKVNETAKEEIYLIKSMHTHPLYYVCAVAAKQRKQINFDVCSHVNLPPSPSRYHHKSSHCKRGGEKSHAKKTRDCLQIVMIMKTILLSNCKPMFLQRSTHFPLLIYSFLFSFVIKNNTSQT